MQTVPASVQSHLSVGSTFYLATCWKIDRVDGVTLRFTSADTNIEVEGPSDDGIALYEASGGFEASAGEKSTDQSSGNRNLRGAITSDKIATIDLIQQRYRGATVTEFAIDWLRPFTGPFNVSRYVLAGVEFDGEIWQADCVGLRSKLQRTAGDVYQKNCRFDLGDAMCGVNLASFRALSVVVAEVLKPRRQFRAVNLQLKQFANRQNGVYTRGFVTWKTGANAGLRFRVKNNVIENDIVVIQNQQVEPQTFTFLYETYADIEVGDIFDVEPGCNKKKHSDCDLKYQNTLRFGGQDYIPGDDKALAANL